MVCWANSLVFQRVKEQKKYLSYLLTDNRLKIEYNYLIIIVNGKFNI